METNESILTREVVAIDDRKKLGKLKDLCLDCDTCGISYYIINNTKTNSSLVLPFEKAIAVGDTFMTIQNRNDVLSTSDSQSSNTIQNGFRLVKSEVYSRTGNRLGVVKGYEFDPVFGAVTKIILEEGQSFDADTFVFFSEDFVFVDDGEATAAELRSGGAAQSPSQAASAVVDAQDEDYADEAEVDVVEEVVEEEPVSDQVVEEAGEAEEAQAEGDDSEDEVLRKFLIGAVLNDDVESKDGVFKASKGTELTEAMIDEAQAHDALLLLTMSVDA